MYYSVVGDGPFIVRCFDASENKLKSVELSRLVKFIENSLEHEERPATSADVLVIRDFISTLMNKAHIFSSAGKADKTLNVNLKVLSLGISNYDKNILNLRGYQNFLIKEADIIGVMSKINVILSDFQSVCGSIIEKSLGLSVGLKKNNNRCGFSVPVKLKSKKIKRRSAELHILESKEEDFIFRCGDQRVKIRDFDSLVKKVVIADNNLKVALQTSRKGASKLSRELEEKVEEFEDLVERAERMLDPLAKYISVINRCSNVLCEIYNLRDVNATTINDMKGVQTKVMKSREFKRFFSEQKTATNKVEAADEVDVDTYVRELHREVGEVVGVVRGNVNAIVDRGGKIDDLFVRADSLADKASGFKVTGKNLHKNEVQKSRNSKGNVILQYCSIVVLQSVLLHLYHLYCYLQPAKGYQLQIISCYL